MSSDPIEVLRRIVELARRHEGHDPQLREALASLSAPKPESAEAVGEPIEDGAETEEDSPYLRLFVRPRNLPAGVEALRDLRDRVIPAALRHYASGPGYIEEAQEIVSRALASLSAPKPEGEWGLEELECRKAELEGTLSWIVYSGTEDVGAIRERACTVLHAHNPPPLNDKPESAEAVAWAVTAPGFPATVFTGRDAEVTAKDYASNGKGREARPLIYGDTAPPRPEVRPHPAYCTHDFSMNPRRCWKCKWDFREGDPPAAPKQTSVPDDPITSYYTDRNRGGWAAPRHPTAADEASAPDTSVVGVEAIIEAFDEITGLCRHLRQGGPAPEDLHDLSGALDEAIGIAGNMLAALTQQPSTESRCDHCGGFGDVTGEYPGVACPKCRGTGLAQQPAACDMGELCIGCEPRNPDGSCPDQQPAAVDEADKEGQA